MVEDVKADWKGLEWTSTRPRPLTRSRSTLDLSLGQAALAPAGASASATARQYSTAASPAISESQLDMDIDYEYVPTTIVRSSSTTSALPPVQRKLTQPNRVLMDLAGLDVPSRRRTYTTSSAEATSATDDDVAYPSENDNDETDKRIYSAIHHATQTGRKDLVQELVAYYRSARDEKPATSRGKELAKHLPLPEGYTVNTYNACIRGLLATRQAGESIASVLEIYNEMLERDLVPNGRTYADVIRALCIREKDVQAAVGRYRDDRKWASFRRRNLGLKTKTNTSATETEQEDPATIKGYIAEGNLDSAYQLFRGIASVQAKSSPTGFYRFHPHVYSYLLDAMAGADKPDKSRAIEVFEHSYSTETAGRRMLYKHLFRVLAARNDADGVLALWERFDAERAEGLGNKMREWKDVLPGLEVEDREVQVEGFQAEVWTAAIIALIQTGSTAKGLELLELMTNRLGEQQRSVALSEPPRPSGDTLGSVVIALAQKREFDLAKHWYERTGKGQGQGLRTRPYDIVRYIDALVDAGQWKEATGVYLAWITARGDAERVDHTRIKRIYSALLADAKHASPDQASEILSHVTPLLSSADILLDTELATQHIEILLQHGRYAQVASVLDAFGPMNVRLDREDRLPLLRLLDQIATSPITLPDLLDVLRAFARQRVHPLVERQTLVESVVDRYLEFRSPSPADTSMPSAAAAGLGAENWMHIFRVVARTAGDRLQEGGYDQALESLMADLKTYAPSTLGTDLEGRLDLALATRLFNRFGSDRATEMLSPLMGEEATAKLLAPLFDQAPGQAQAQAGPSTPDLTSASDSTLSDSPATPLTPPPTQKRYSDKGPRMDTALSRKIDTHVDRNPQLSAGAAYAEIRQSLATQGIVPHPASMGRLMITLAQQGDESRVLELYNLAQQIPQVRTQPAMWRLVEDAMLIAQCHLGHLEQAGLHRHRLVQAGTPPSADAYATMIASSKETTDDALVARELFDESQQLGVRPHLYLYNTVISKLSKARKAEAALELFAQMKAQDVKPSSVTYGAVINACCRVGDAESAETLFQEMRSRPNFRPRVPPFNTMMQFYLQTRPSRERVLSYYAALRQSGVAPSSHTYKLLLDTYHTLAPLDLTSMERTFAELCACAETDRTLRVQGTHWASLITAYGLSAGDVTKALEVFDLVAQHPHGNNALAEPVVWEAILNVLAAKGTVEQMESMRERMSSSAGSAGAGVRPTAYVYNVLITGYARHGRMDDARAVFESMGDSITGVAAPNNHPAHLKHSSSTSTTTPTPISDDPGVVYREPSTYEVMIRAELSSGNFDHAQQVLQRMEDRRYPIAVYLKARALVEGTIGAGAGADGVDSYHHVPWHTLTVEPQQQQQQAEPAQAQA